MDRLIYYCKSGNLQKIKKISLINCNLEVTFIIACKSGSLRTVQYLCELYKQNILHKPINMYSCNYGFQIACKNGAYKIVKYLCHLYDTNKYYYQPINITLNLYNYITIVCINNDIKIIKYLCNLYKISNEYQIIKLPLSHMRNLFYGCRWYLSLRMRVFFLKLYRHEKDANNNCYKPVPDDMFYCSLAPEKRSGI